MTTEGVIGVPCAEQARWSAFWAHLAELERPPGTIVRVCRGSSTARNRNVIVNEALKADAPWVFFLDDDLVFRPDVLLRLLAHDVDAVVGLSLRRQPPFEPIWFARNAPRQDAMVTDLPRSSQGLVPLAAATSGGLLVRTEVFRRIPPPWWTLGQVVPDEWCDDLDFCRKLAEAGIPLWGDPAVRFGHLTAVEVWPHETEDGWQTVLARSQTPFASIPMRALQPA